MQKLELLGLSNPAMCKVLGMSKQHMQHYRKNGAELPAYISAHVDTLLAIPAELRAKIILEKLSGISDRT